MGSQNNFNIKDLIEGIGENKIILSFITLFTLFNFIQPGINNLYKVSLDRSAAIQLITEYENAYYDVFTELLLNDYYNETDINKKDEIKRKSKKRFKKIVSEDVYKEIENDIFAKNLYSDIKNYVYRFDYIHTINTNKDNLNINFEDDSLQLINPKIYKYTRGKNNKTNYIKPDSKYETTINADNRIYTVRKKYFIFGNYILDTRRDI